MGQTIDCLLTAARDEQAAKRLLTKAMRRPGVPETSTIDGSVAHAAAIKRSNAEHATVIAIRKVKYLNNIEAQDHRGVKRITRPLLGCKAFDVVQATLVGIELMHMIKKRQLVVEEGNEASLRLNCCTSWPPHPCHRQGQLPLHDLWSKICDTILESCIKEQV